MRTHTGRPCGQYLRSSRVITSRTSASRSAGSVYQPPLIAALQATVCSSSSRRLSGGAAGAGVEGVIAVLCEIDGLDLCGGPEASAGDRLLDWQDAPCRDLL